MYDGGSDIIGYSVEFAEVTRGQKDIDDAELQWGQAVGKMELRTTTYTVGGLTSGKDYRFRVFAHNVFGASEPSMTPSTVKPVDRQEAPGVSPDAELPRSLSVRAGGSIR